MSNLIKGPFVCATWELLISAYEPFKSQKSPSSQKSEAYDGELLGFWLIPPTVFYFNFLKPKVGSM